jgi:hypothetical protein
LQSPIGKKKLERKGKKERGSQMGKKKEQKTVVYTRTVPDRMHLSRKA